MSQVSSASGRRSIGDRVADAAVWAMAARFGVRAVNVLGLLVLARLLTPADFGVAAMAMAVVLVAEVVTDFQFTAALVRKSDLRREDLDTAWTLNALAGLLTLGAIAAASGPIAQLLGRPETAGALALTGLFAFFNSLRNPRFVEFTRRISLQQSTVVLVISKIAGVGTSIALAMFWRADYWALIIGTLTGAAVRTALTYAYRPYLPTPRLSSARELFGFSGWLMAARAVQELNSQSDKFFLLARLDASAIGVYKMGQTLLRLPTTEVVRPLVRGLFPAFSRIRDDSERVAASYLSAQQVVLMIGLPIGFGLPFIAEPLISVALGAQWADAALIIEYLAPITALQMTVAGVEGLVMALDGTRRLFMRALLFLVIRVPLLLAGVMLGGLEGLLAARAATGLLFLGLNLQLIHRMIEVRPMQIFINAARSWGAAAAMIGALLAAIEWGPDAEAAALGALVLRLACAGATYVLAHALLWELAGRPAGPERRLLSFAMRRLGAGRKALQP